MDPSKIEIDNVFDTVMYKLKNESAENFDAAIVTIVEFGKFFDEMQIQELFLKFYSNINQVLPYLELDPSLESNFSSIYVKISNDLDEYLDEYVKKFGEVHGDVKHEVHIDYLQHRLMKMSILVALDEYIGFPFLSKFGLYFKDIREAINSLKRMSFYTNSNSSRGFLR